MRGAGEKHGARSPPLYHILAASPTGSNLEAIYDYVARFDGVLHWNGAEILEWYACAYQKLDPTILMMKSAEDRLSNKLAEPVDRPTARRILV